MRKSHSLKTKLLSSNFLAFAIFFSSVGITASVIYSVNANEVVTTQNITLSKQAINNYDVYFDNSIEVSNSIQNKILNIDINSEKEAVLNYFDDILTIKKEMLSLSMYDMDGNFIVGHESDHLKNVSNESWFINAKNNQIINNFGRVNLDEGTYHFTISKMMSYNKDQNYTVLKATFDFTKIVDLISKTDLGENGHIFIYDNSYNVVYSSEPRFIDDDLKISKKVVLGSSNVHFKDTDFFTYISTIPNTTWKVGVFINSENLKNILTTFLLSLGITFIITMVLAGIYTYALATSVSGPLSKLQKEMLKVESLNYELDDYEVIKGSKEIEEIDNSFKTMMGRIKELAKKIIEEDEEKRKSELKALQNQINPHFLYNTLDSIIYLIDNNENEKASKMIVALSKFFRISISRGKTIISVKDEIEHVRNYLLIQKMRYEDKFEFNINVDPSLYEYKTIKLILQPIVENAIVHGLQESEDVSKINITGISEGNLIHFIIEDNGFGILPDKIDEIYTSFNEVDVHNGVGLKNVYQRIRIYFGEEADIKIESELDVGTKIHIYIPKKGEMNEK